MWMITEKGFISAVAYNGSKDPVGLSKRRRKRLGKDPILARARVKDDLEQLREFFPYLVIEDNKTADYEFRALIPRKAFMEWAMTYAGKIDYDSHFKEVASKRSPAAKGRHEAMMSVWSAMSKLQPSAPYGGGWSGGAASNLCDYREVKEIKATGEKVLGAWCNYKKGHAGKCEFEIKGGGSLGKDQSNYKGAFAAPKQQTLPGIGGVKLCKGKHGALGDCTLPQGHGGMHKWQHPEQPADGCMHRKHEFRNGAWMGSYATGSNAWFHCDAYGGTAAVRDNDTVIGMMRSLRDHPVSAAKLDDDTPNEVFEVWSAADYAYGNDAQLTEAQVADLIVELIEDLNVPDEFKDTYLEALDEFGWQVDDPAEPSMAVPAESGTVLESNTDDLPSEQVTAAVAEKEEVVS
jgi:hypothetical protein